jgi:hypothetical protein
LTSILRSTPDSFVNVKLKRHEKIEMRVRILESYFVMARAGCNQDIVRWCRLACLSTSSRKSAGFIPNVIGNGKIRQPNLVLAQHSAVRFASDAVPKFQPNQWAPGGLAGLKQMGYASADPRITAVAKIMDPARRIDDDHSPINLLDGSS